MPEEEYYVLKKVKKRKKPERKSKNPFIVAARSLGKAVDSVEKGFKEFDKSVTGVGTYKETKRTKKEAYFDFPDL